VAVWLDMQLICGLTDCVVCLLFREFMETFECGDRDGKVTRCCVHTADVLTVFCTMLCV
jgi:hypothetical protein